MYAALGQEQPMTPTAAGYVVAEGMPCGTFDKKLHQCLGTVCCAMNGNRNFQLCLKEEDCLAGPTNVIVDPWVPWPGGPAEPPLEPPPPEPGASTSTTGLVVVAVVVAGVAAYLLLR